MYRGRAHRLTKGANVAKRVSKPRAKAAPQNVADEQVAVPFAENVETAEPSPFKKAYFQGGLQYIAGQDVDAVTPGSLGKCERIELQTAGVVVMIRLPSGKRQIKVFAGWPCELTEAAK